MQQVLLFSPHISLKPTSRLLNSGPQTSTEHQTPHARLEWIYNQSIELIGLRIGPCKSKQTQVYGNTRLCQQNPQLGAVIFLFSSQQREEQANTWPLGRSIGKRCWFVCIWWAAFLCKEPPLKYLGNDEVFLRYRKYITTSTCGRLWPTRRILFLSHAG